VNRIPLHSFQLFFRMPQRMAPVSSKRSADETVSANDEPPSKRSRRVTFKLRQEDRQPVSQQRMQTTKPPTQRKKRAPVRKNASANSAGVKEVTTSTPGSQRVPAHVDVEKDNDETFDLDDRDDRVGIMVCFSLRNHCL
jgi:hypothetical protein